MSKTAAPVKPSITTQDLDKIDIRVGKIVLIDNVVKSNKLVRLTVDFDDHQRKIISGMKAEREDVNEILGCKLCSW